MVMSGIGLGYDHAGRSITLPALENRFNATSIVAFDQRWLMPAIGGGWRRSASVELVNAPLPKRRRPQMSLLPPLPAVRYR